MGSAREAKGCFFWRGRNGGTKTRRAVESKQKHAVSPARRGVPQLAVPAKRVGVRNECDGENQAGQEKESSSPRPERGWRSLSDPAERFQEKLEGCQEENAKADGEL